jgi:hypothetical protein
VLHAIAILWHDPASVQSAPLLHAPQLPALQTAPASQTAPFIKLVVGVH